MSKRPTLQVIAAVVGFATALAIFNMLKRCDGRPSGGLKPIGEITAVEGSVERRTPGAVNIETVPGPRPLYHQDLLVTQRASTATITLTPDGPTLRLNENTRFIAEIDATRHGAFIGTLLDGTLSVLNSGRKGLFRLFREGREIPLESAERRLVPVIPAEGTAPSSQAAVGGTPSPMTGGIIITATSPSEEAQPTPKPESTAPQAANSASPLEAESEILTNDDIIKTLRGQTGFFQRCYLGFIHRSGSNASSQSGKVTLRFKIQPSGKVSDASILRSDFRDSTLNNCVREVLERARFKIFRGPAVPVEEFPISLQ